MTLNFPLKKFWTWYERHYALNVSIAAGIFVLQLVHLVWMSLHVVAFKFLGHSLFNPSGFWQILIIFADYLEIPGIIGVSLVYLHALQKGFKLKPLIYLILINSQWLHLFWITDEVVYQQFTGAAAVVLPVWLSWLGLSIDYLELPVIFDTIKKALRVLKEPNLKKLRAALKD